MLGLLGMLVGASMVFSLPWAFPACGQAESFESRGFWGLVAAILVSLVVGGGLYFYGRSDRSSVLRKEALAVVGLGWLLAGHLGALPYLLGGVQRAPGVMMHAPDALFESLSGFTTTGASVLTELEDPSMVPRCVLFWRSFTHWLGGMGIIVLFVAILGQLGAGGKAIMKREVPRSDQRSGPSAGPGVGADDVGDLRRHQRGRDDPAQVGRALLVRRAVSHVRDGRHRRILDVQWERRPLSKSVDRVDDHRVYGRGGNQLRAVLRDSQNNLAPPRPARADRRCSADSCRCIAIRSIGCTGRSFSSPPRL